MFQTIPPSTRKRTYTVEETLEIAWCREVFHMTARGTRPNLAACDVAAFIHYEVRGGQEVNPGAKYAKGDRVRFHDRALAPSFDKDSAYKRQPRMIWWYGTVIRYSQTSGTYWVQWDCMRKGWHRPVQPDDLVPATASRRQLILD
jgi:hypothetical protein